MWSPSRTQLIVWLFLIVASFGSNYPAVHAAASLTKVLATTGSSSEREGALYVVKDQGYFRKYGLVWTSP